MRIAVTHVPLACCALETSAAFAQDLPAIVDGHEIGVDSKADLNILVVAGTVTHAGRSALEDLWNNLPEPKRAIAYGVCASSGGPYWDSPAVIPGLENVMPVQRFVPGCPPPRATMIDAIVATAQEFAGEVS